MNRTSIVILCLLVAIDIFLFLEVNQLSQVRIVFLQSVAAHIAVAISFCALPNLRSVKRTMSARRYWLAAIFLGLHGIAYSMTIIMGQFLASTVLQESYYWRKAEEVLLIMLLS